MRAWVATALVFCLAGCAAIQQVNADYRPYLEHKVLYELDGWETKQNKGIYTTEEVGRYLSFFVDRWVARGLPGTREQIEEKFKTITLHWQQTKFIDPEGDKEQRLLGLTYVRYFRDEYTVFVYDCSQETRPVLGKTALGHELIHVALHVTTKYTRHKHFELPEKEWPIRYLDLQEEVNAAFK